VRESTLPNVGSTNDDTGRLAATASDAAGTAEGTTSMSATIAIAARLAVMPVVIADPYPADAARGGTSLSVNTQLEPEDRAAADLALEAHVTAVRLDDLARYRQPETHAADSS
jgi:hypothetical protein